MVTTEEYRKAPPALEELHNVECDECGAPEGYLCNPGCENQYAYKEFE